MKFNYKLKRLCGAYYGHPITTTASASGSSNQWSGATNLAYDSTGNLLVSAVSNRLQVLDLRTQTVRTLPIECRSNVRCFALSPDDSLLVAVDVQNRAQLVNFRRGIVLCRFSLKGRVRRIEFSPSGDHLAVTVGKHVQVWGMPSSSHATQQFCPLQLHRTYTGQVDDATCLTWSGDGSVMAAGSRDCSVRLWSLHTTKNYEPVTLAGHKRAIVGAYLVNDPSTGQIALCYSISEDGALVTWECSSSKRGGNEEDEAESIGEDGVKNEDEGDLGDEAVDFFTGGGGAEPDSNKRRKTTRSTDSGTLYKSQAHQLVGATWSVKSRHYFHQDGATVTSTSFCSGDSRQGQQGQILAVGFSSGIFGLYEMPSAANIHTLSVGNGQLVKACSLNRTGEWLALGCPASQQLLVWEWRSETYVLKQRGHVAGTMRCMAYSPDGIIVATGGDDGKIKLWNATSGFCYATLGGGESGSGSHTAGVTAIACANASVVLSASLDGTVKAHDLHRYRTFKTLTTPTPVQFLSLAVDPSGELVCAGTSNPFHVFAWNLQTAKLLDVFTGHEGPVCDLTFQPNGGTLVSASWDGTCKLWDLYKGNSVPTESLSHTSDVVCVACRPDGKEICTGTIGGLLSFWDVERARLKYEIDGRRDIAGGRKINDRMTADNNASSRYFTSVRYSADGTCVLAGGNSKYVCIYEVSQQILLKKFQVTYNRSLDGVLDELNSKLLTDGGPIDDHADSGDEAAESASYLPGARRGDDGSRKSKTEVLTTQVAFSSTGREWATVSGEGLHVYSLDEDMIFDPISLTEEVTPAAVESKMASRVYGVALRMAIHLNEFALVKQVLEDTPYDSIPPVVSSISSENSELERLVQFVAKVTEESPHVEFYLQWSLQLLQTHGMQMDRHRGSFMRAFRALHKAIQTRHDELKAICDENRYTLDVLDDQTALAIRSSSSKS